MSMIKEKKLNVSFLGFCLGLAVLVFIYNEYFCTGLCYVTFERGFLEPLFFGLLGFIPTLMFLLFFSERLFISWMKHIAWWSILMTIFFVSSNENESAFSNFGDDVFVVLSSAAVLFVVTLLYAPIMKGKLI